MVFPSVSVIVADVPAAFAVIVMRSLVLVPGATTGAPVVSAAPAFTKVAAVAPVVSGV